ncbi:hypothetical protein C3L33_01891, partial [Rhododendron williamsianum]
MKIRRNIEERNLIVNHISCSVLQGNAITGEIPEEFGNLTSLTMMNLDNNHLTGEIPPSLGNLPKLKFLYVLLSAYLSQNNLTGTIPDSLSHLASLTEM